MDYEMELRHVCRKMISLKQLDLEHTVLYSLHNSLFYELAAAYANEKRVALIEEVNKAYDLDQYVK